MVVTEISDLRKVDHRPANDKGELVILLYTICGDSPMTNLGITRNQMF